MFAFAGVLLLSLSFAATAAAESEDASADGDLIQVDVGVGADGVPSVAVSWSIDVGPAYASGSYGGGASSEEPAPPPAPAPVPAPAEPVTAPAPQAGAAQSSEPGGVSPASTASPQPTGEVAAASGTEPAPVVEEAAPQRLGLTPMPKSLVRVARSKGDEPSGPLAKTTFATKPRLEPSAPVRTKERRRSRAAASVCGRSLVQALGVCGRPRASASEGVLAEARVAARRAVVRPRSVAPVVNPRAVPSSPRKEKIERSVPSSAGLAAVGAGGAGTSAEGIPAGLLVALLVAVLGALTMLLVRSHPLPSLVGAAPTGLLAMSRLGRRRTDGSAPVLRAADDRTARAAKAEPKPVDADAASTAGTSSLADVGPRVAAILASAEEAAQQLVADASAEAAKLRTDADEYAEKRMRDARDNATRITAKAAEEARAFEQESRQRLEAVEARRDELMSLTQALQAELQNTIANWKEPFDRLEALVNEHTDASSELPDLEARDDGP